MSMSKSQRHKGESSVILEDDSPSKSRGWQFTWNNYTDEDIEYLKNLTYEYICWGKEIGTLGTPHLQGFIYFANARPFNSVRKILKNNHIEKARSFDALVKYNEKQGDFYEYGLKPKMGIKNHIPELGYKNIKTIIPYGWQLDVLQILLEEPDDRTIHWFWEPTGKMGKSSLTKYLCIHHDALTLSGKGSDCKFAVSAFIKDKKREPKIIIFDVPRTNIDYINYEAIESIKNGCFFSGKYESTQVIINSPHIFVFANSPPDLFKMSSDRWHIIHIQPMLPAEVDQTTPHNTLSDVPTDK